MDKEAYECERKSNLRDRNEFYESDTTIANVITKATIHYVDNTNENVCNLRTVNKVDTTIVANVCKDEKPVALMPKKVSNNTKRVTSRRANSLYILLRIVKCVTMLVKKWMVIIVLISCACALKEQKFAIEPQDQVSRIGL